MPKKTSADRPQHSAAWLERYGRSLTPDEIRLVQAYRGLPTDKQSALITLASSLVLDETRPERDIKKSGQR